VSRRTVLTILLTMVTLTAGLWTPPAHAANRLLLMKAFKGTSGGTVLVRSEPFVSSWQPTGWSTCLIHERHASDLIDHTGSQPLPDAIDSRAVVGCDARLEAGKQTVDFTRKNSSSFDRFARRLTNGDDQMLWSQVFVVDDRLIPYAMGGGGCWESCTGWKQPSAKRHGKRSAPDLKGFKIDLIRLRVRTAHWGVEPADGGFHLSASWSFTWEIYGRKTHR
jgi:hypothetical protein